MHSPLDQSLDSEDFQEAPSVARSKGFHPIAVGIIGALCGLVLAIMLIRGSMPELTPEQIVAMDGYEGRQPPRHIFNLDSLHPASSATESPETVTTDSQSSGVDYTSQPAADSAPAATPVANTQAVVAAADASDTETLAIKTLALKTEEPKDSWALEIVEVPASPIIVGKDAQEVAAPVVEEFDYRKLNRRNSKSIMTSDAAITMSAATESEDNGNPQSAIRVLPVLTVNTDNTYVRAEPSSTADVKMVLARGMSVTAFEKSGVWVYVGANDGSSTTGYVHQSSVAVTELN